MGEGEEVNQPDEEGQQDEPQPLICSNCKTENNWNSRLCKVCFAPLSRGLSKLCPHCMTPTDESAHMCPKCLTPLSSHATIDPVMGITARMDTIGKAATTPRKPIVLVGMWIIFGPITFFLFLFIMAAPGVAKLIPAAMAVVPLMLLFKTTSNFLKGPPATEKDGFPVNENELDDVVQDANADDEENTPEENEGAIEKPETND